MVDNKDSRKGPEHWNRKGKMLLDRGDLEGAVDCFSRSLIEDPGSYTARSNLEYTLELVREREDILLPNGDLDSFSTIKKKKR